MAWVSPMTFVAGSVLTAAQLNTHLRDNLNETAAAKATSAGQIFVATGANALAARIPSSNFIVTSETTGSTVYTDLLTAGPAVTVTTGTRALVLSSAFMLNNIATSRCFTSYAVTGATADPATDARAQLFQPESIDRESRSSVARIHSGLTPGSNTFTMKYRVTAGTGTFASRDLSVVPF